MSYVSSMFAAISSYEGRRVAKRNTAREVTPRAAKFGVPTTPAQGPGYMPMPPLSFSWMALRSSLDALAVTVAALPLVSNFTLSTTACGTPN